MTEGKKDKEIYKRYIDYGYKFCEEGLKLDDSHGKCNSVIFN